MISAINMTTNNTIIDVWSAEVNVDMIVVSDFTITKLDVCITRLELFVQAPTTDDPSLISRPVVKRLESEPEVARPIGRAYTIVQYNYNDSV